MVRLAGDIDNDTVRGGLETADGQKEDLGSLEVSDDQAVP